MFEDRIMYDNSPWSASQLSNGGNGNFRTYLSPLPPRIASPTSTVMKQVGEPSRKFYPQMAAISFKKEPEARTETSVPFLIPSPTQYMSSHNIRMTPCANRPPPLSTDTSPENDNLQEFCPVQRNLPDKKSPFAGNTWMMERQNRSRTENQSQMYQEMIRCNSLTDQAIALEMMRWVRYAARPLHIGELLDAIRIQMSIKISESDVERISSGLLMKTKVGTVCSVRSSVGNFQEFHNSEQVTMGCHVISATAHEILAVICLKKLEHGHLLRKTDTSAEIDVPNTDIDIRWPDLSSYAKQHWRYHYTEAESQSCFLPGMLHEKLRDDWKYGNQFFFSKFPPIRTAAGMPAQRLLDWGTMTFLNAALEEGVRSGMVKLVKLELETGASPNASDPSGNTPLHFAVRAGNLEVVKLLLKYHGNVNTRSRSGDTPLSLAVENRHIEVFKLLLNSGSTPGNTYIGSENTWVSSHCTYQKLSLLVSCSSCCYNCGRRFVLSKVPGNEEDEELWYPISISAKSKSQAKCQAAILNEKRDCCSGTMFAQQAITVKWFTGINMYRALSKAARGGVEDILRFLVLAGNNVEFLRGNNILSEILSKMQVS